MVIKSRSLMLRSVALRKVLSNTTLSQIAESALDDCQGNVSCTAPISAIPVRSLPSSERCDKPGAPAVAGKAEVTGDGLTDRCKTYPGLRICSWLMNFARRSRGEGVSGQPDDAMPGPPAITPGSVTSAIGRLSRRPGRALNIGAFPDLRRCPYRSRRRRGPSRGLPGLLRSHGAPWPGTGSRGRRFRSSSRPWRLACRDLFMVGSG